jgi:hypothetical protein
MADYLTYWKQYWDTRRPRGDRAGNWATTSVAFYKRARKFDGIWIVVNGGPASPQEWRLLEYFAVATHRMAQTPNGRYNLVGKPGSRIQMRLEEQPDLAAVLRLLRFRGGKPIRVRGAAIGKSLQSNGFRQLSEKDADLLHAYAATIRKR